MTDQPDAAALIAEVERWLRDNANAQTQRDSRRVQMLCEHCGHAPHHSTTGACDFEFRGSVRMKPRLIGGLLDLLRALSGRVEQQTWQPIATAPKDGTMVIGFDPVVDDEWIIGVEFMRWLDGAWLDPSTHTRKPTHWMPLPTPPAEART